MSRIIGGCFALAAFAVAIVAGLAADNSAGSILVRALIALAVCYPVGYIVGIICDRVIATHVQSLEPARDDHAPDADVRASEDPEEVLTV